MGEISSVIKYDEWIGCGIANEKCRVWSIEASLQQYLQCIRFFCLFWQGNINMYHLCELISRAHWIYISNIIYAGDGLNGKYFGIIWLYSGNKASIFIFSADEGRVVFYTVFNLLQSCIKYNASITNIYYFKVFLCQYITS